MAGLYSNIDSALLKKDSESCLLNYGTSFHPEIIVSAKGLHITTSSGQKMQDWTSGQMSCLLGHSHPEIAETTHQHALNLDHTFSGMLTPPVISLAKTLTDLLPTRLDRTFFLSTGSESNEAAIKLAKLYTRRFEIVALGGSWHGMTASSLSAQYHSGRRGYGPNMPGNLMLPAPNAYRSVFRHADGSYDWRAELEYGFGLVDQASCGSLAALILEPILSSGGMLVLPKGYLREVKRCCEKRGMLLIVDEAQTAIGRAGDMFAFQHQEEEEDDDDEGDEPVVPDILTLSKTLGNGIPLAAVVTSEEIASRCEERGYCFYTTHVNDPLPAAVGLKVLEIVVRDDLVGHSRRLGLKFHAGLRRLESRYGCIGDVRGRGLMAGVEIVGDRETKEPAIDVVAGLADRMVKFGLWAQLATMPSFGCVFRIAPPITVTEEELEQGLAIMEKAFRETPGTMPLY